MKGEKRKRRMERKFLQVCRSIECVVVVTSLTTVWTVECTAWATSSVLVTMWVARSVILC